MHLSELSNRDLGEEIINCILLEHEYFKLKECKYQEPRNHLHSGRKCSHWKQ